MNQFILGSNLGFCCAKLGRNINAHNYFVTNRITDKGITSSLDNSNIFPLYLYKKDGTRTPNLKSEIVIEIENITGQTTPENIFDYVYAMLYSPSYREKYKEFLKIDFPRVPYPNHKEEFWQLVALGNRLRGLHLLTDPVVNRSITTYPILGSNEVESISNENGKVFINSSQYFGDVPDVAWNFYIGGYQPAQKYLKDRKGTVLTDHDIRQWQEMIVSLTETDKVMKDIDALLISTETGSKKSV